VTISPAIDALAGGGIKLSSYYVMVVCSPTRSALMTGRYSWRAGFYSVGGKSQAVNASFAMLPQVLKDVGGYTSVAVGKWHLGYFLKEYTPTYRGFDKYLGYYAAAMSSYWYHGAEDASCLNGFSTELSNNTGPVVGGASPASNDTYATRLFTRYAVDSIRSHFSAGAASAAPFYMHVVLGLRGNGI